MKTTIYQTLLYFLLVLSIYSPRLNGQETSNFENTYEEYQQASEYFDLELYAQAIQSVDIFLTKTRNAYEPKEYELYRVQALTLRHISLLRLDLPESETQLKNFIAEHYPHPEIIDAIFEMGDYYYNEKQYLSCIEYLDMIDIDAVPEIKMSEIVFKKGYCHFVRKEFQQAQYTFSFTRDLQNRFFYPTNYYVGMCEYFNGDYEKAVKSFQRVESNAIYKTQIPYYIAQIYFAQKEYDKLLSYGENVIRQTNTNKIKEIRLLLGQAYFQRNNYEKALPHLEYYEKNTTSLTIEEFYQLAFTQYQLGYCDRAIDNLLELNREDSKLGQVVNYYLADCYEKSGDKQSARAAFKKVSQMDYDRGMKEEATFNYGKLSAEMGQEREAINVLMAIDQNSPYYEETQNIINDILLNTGDFLKAIEILESIPQLNTKLEMTYQKVTFKQGLQYLSENKPDLANAMFSKSITKPFDKSIIAQIDFWQATMLNNEGDYERSISSYKRYFSSAKQANDLPEETQLYVASYNQAYNYLKLEKFEDASVEFKKAIVGINQDRTKIKNPIIFERLLPDAYLRAGDCLFKLNRYNDAVTYYDQSISKKAPGYGYALFQRGLIEGLLDQPFEKIITLETLVDNLPDSDYADDALLQLGDTYLSLGNPIHAAEAFLKLRTDYKNRSNLVNAANLKLGLINYNQGDLEGALIYYKSVFQNNPNPKESQEAIIAIEEIYIDDLGKANEYISFLKTVPGYEITAFSKDSLNYKIGEIQFQNSNYEKAIAGFDQYLRDYSNGFYRLEARYYRGESHSLLKNYTKALIDYEAIIGEGISDHYERALKKAAIISYNHSQNFTSALEYYKLWEAQSENPEDKYQAQIGALRSAFRLGRDEDIVLYSNKVIQNVLASKEDKSNSMYYLAKVLYKNKDYEQASSAFNQVSILSNNNQAAESRYLMAKIQFDQGQIDKAEIAANEANERNSNYPFWIAKSILLLSDIYLSRNDLLNARAAAEAVVENFKSDASLVEEAKAKLDIISKKEKEGNRIKPENLDGILELDTTGNH